MLLCLHPHGHETSIVPMPTHMGMRHASTVDLDSSFKECCVNEGTLKVREHF